MAAAIRLRDDYDSGVVRAAAKRSKDGPQARRLLTLAAIYFGSRRTEARRRLPADAEPRTAGGLARFVIRLGSPKGAKADYRGATRHAGRV
jgi:hypothetical protein